MLLSFNEEKKSGWNLLYIFMGLFLMFGLLIISLFNLQVVQSATYTQRSTNNQLNISYIYPDRGIILDREGRVLAENLPSTDLYISFTSYVDDKDELKIERLEEKLALVEQQIGDKWTLKNEDGEQEYKSLLERVQRQFAYANLYPSLASLAPGGRSDSEDMAEVDQLLTGGLGERWLGLVEDRGEEAALLVVWRELEDLYYQYEALIGINLTNQQTIALKSLSESIPGLRLDEASKRHYLGGESMTHVLGYTSAVTYEDWQELDYVGLSDTVGKLGVERIYDEKLIGQKGLFAYEVDAYGNRISGKGRTVAEPVSGESLHLTIDKDVQEEMYRLLKRGTHLYGASGAAGILQDVESGELIALASYPSYDNNLFVEGISSEDFEKLKDPIRTPLLNRTISAQLPPGSTFKTLAAIGALDSGAITTSTVYVSKSNYEFSNGAPFQEYRGNSYGPLDIYDALSVSSNIFFCETIREWEIDEYIPYLEMFGIGKPTGVDLLGETPGRLPSPENKIALANTPGITWLDPIWYPEGDGCNTVIGQGITLVTPLQMNNWTAAIANRGVLLTPHVAKSFEDSEGELSEISFESTELDLNSKGSIDVVQEGMRLAVAGPRATITGLRGANIKVAAKTGTAEFGRLNAVGQYEHTHAWVTGFFPYDNPQYSFTILLEDGGESYNAVEVARDFIDWWATQ